MRLLTRPILLALYIPLLVSAPVTAAPKIEVFAGDGTTAWNGDGLTATATAIAEPLGLALDNEGRVLIAEGKDGRILRVQEDGTVVTVAGCGFGGFGGDGGNALEAFLSRPMGIVTDASGGIFFADQKNHRIRRIDINGTIETVAGNGQGFMGLGTFGGDGGEALQASLNFPTKLAIGKDGSVFIADQMNARIRRLDPSGQVTTVLGGGDSGLQALLHPVDIDLDSRGNLLVADAKAGRIISASVTGQVILLLGQPPDPSILPAFPLTALTAPYAVAAGPDGAVFWAESNQAKVCRITPGSTAETLMQGTGRLKRPGQPENEGLGQPVDLLLVPEGALLVADPGSHRVWKISGWAE
jgi:glucose/arabinose dehydrogenase